MRENSRRIETNGMLRSLALAQAASPRDDLAHKLMLRREG